MNIVVLSGTNRAGSRTLKVARLVERAYREAGVEPQLMDLQELPAACFEPTAYRSKPAAFAPWAEAVLAADGVHWVVPEYNGSFPGVAKLFIDLLKFPESFDRRPMAYTGLAAGRWGALRAVEQLQMVVGYRNAYSYPERVFLADVHEVLDDQGQLTDGELQERLERQAKGFLDFARRLRAA